jgi:glycosyltransferase involved in cell wall biosynthesis
MLKIPVEGTYDISYNVYIQRLAGDDDESIDDLIARFILWFYDQMDTVFVLNAESKALLEVNGIDGRKIIRLFPEIDLARFNPSRRNGFFRKHYGIVGKTKLLYEGPLTKESNLPLLAETYKMLLQSHSDMHLVVVGEGPYRKQVEHLLDGLPCTFTGQLKPDKLSVVYASSDIFILPGSSTSDLSSIARAQASGLPIIVTARPGNNPQVTDKRTGLVADADDAVGLCDAVKRLVADRRLAGQLGRAARATIENRHWYKTLSAPLRHFISDHPGGASSCRKTV